MGSDSGIVKTVEVPPLKPLNIKARLAGTPTRLPKYSVNVKNLAGEEVIIADPRATRALVALMNMHAVNGGAACHWGGPAAFAEINAAIHGIMFSTKGRQWYEAFNFVNDAGHTENGIYALRANYGFDNLTFEDLKGFRSLSSKLTGHGESHLNPEGVLISNGPLGSGLPQAQGLAIADKIAVRDRVTICTVSDGAAMEGEAKESFAAIPGLAAKGLVNPFVMVISDNDTKLSGRISKDAFSMQPTFESLSVLGWNVIKVQNGHDLQEVYLATETAINEAKSNPSKPVCIWVKTIKGYGVKMTMEDKAGGHGFPLNNAEKIVDFVAEIYNGNPPEEFANWAKSLRSEWEKREQEKKARPSIPPAVKKDKVQAGLAKAIIRAAQEGYPVFSISSDVQGSTGISGFQKAVPDRFIEVGIAEANMVNTGSGFSKMGFIPIVDTFGQFGITKGNLPLIMASLSQNPLIAIFSHIGLQDAADGASHQATTYFAATCAIPHTVIIAPSCADEGEALMYEAIKRQAQDRLAGKDGESYIFFIGRENYPVHLTENANYQWGKAQVIKEGTDVVLVGCGVLVGKIIEAGRILAQQGVNATVINNPFVNRVDVDTIGKYVKASNGRVVTIEDHQLIGGMATLLSHSLSRADVPHRMKSLGIDGKFGQSAYVAEHLYQYHNLTTEYIVKSALDLLK